MNRVENQQPQALYLVKGYWIPIALECYVIRAPECKRIIFKLSFVTGKMISGMKDGSECQPEGPGIQALSGLFLL
jgi:hypothetical protein